MTPVKSGSSRRPGKPGNKPPAKKSSGSKKAGTDKSGGSSKNKVVPPAELDDGGCPEFGGLSSSMLLDLLENGRWVPGGPIELNADLSISELKKVPIISNARMLLLLLDAEGAFQAASDGAFPKELVLKLLSGFVTAGKWLLKSCQTRRSLSERDFPWIFQLRYLCRFAGLIVFRKKAWTLSSLGRELLQDDRAGELFVLLFNALFRQFTLSNMDRFPPVSQFQDSIPYILFRMREIPEGKRVSLGLIPDLVLLPVVAGRLEGASPGEVIAGAVVYLRAIRPLEDFGLLKIVLPKVDEPDAWPSHVSRTLLFDRFIRFRKDLSA